MVQFSAMENPGGISGSRVWPLLPGLAGLTLFLLAALYGYSMLTGVVADTNSRKQARETLLHAEQVLSLLKDLEVGQRGYLLTGDPAFLKPYQDARAQLAAAQSTLRRGLDASQVYAGRFDALEQLITLRMDIAAGNLALRAETEPAPMQSPAKARMEAGKVAMDRIRAEFASLETGLRQRIQALDGRVQAQQARARLAAYGLTTLAGAMLLLAYVLLLREQGRRVRAEQALTRVATDTARRRGAELESVFQALPDLYFRLAWDGTILDYHGRRDELYLPPEQFIGKRMQDVLPPEVGMRFSAEIQAMMTAKTPGHPAFEYVLTMPGGDRHFEARLSRIPGQDEVAVVVRDIEERQQAEITIRKWADAFEHCAHGIALGDARTNRLLACNPAFGALLDQRPEELVGHPILDVYTPAEHALLRERIAQVDALGKVRYEAHMLRRDGGSVPVQLDLVSVRGGDGQPLYRVATIQDISARLAATADMEKARDDLRAFAIKLDRDIETERRRLAREVHDQLGQIFTALKLRLLDCDSARPLDPERLDEFGKLLDEGIRVARRIAADLRPAMLDDLGLGPALAHYGKLLGAQAGCSVDVDIRDDARLGPECVNQIFRIAQEALTNVVRHAAAKRVLVRGEVEDGHYRLTVEDDGRGMAPDGQDGLGMLGMRERAMLIGADLEVGVSPLGGLRLALSLLLIEKEENHAHPAGG